MTAYIGPVQDTMMTYGCGNDMACLEEHKRAPSGLVRPRMISHRASTCVKAVENGDKTPHTLSSDPFHAHKMCSGFGFSSAEIASGASCTERAEKAGFCTVKGTPNELTVGTTGKKKTVRETSSKKEFVKRNKSKCFGHRDSSSQATSISDCLEGEFEHHGDCLSNSSVSGKERVGEDVQLTSKCTFVVPQYRNINSGPAPLLNG